MASDQSKITITAKTRLLKFNEGQNPETDEPAEVVEHEYTFTGEEAEQILKHTQANGGTVNAIN